MNSDLIIDVGLNRGEDSDFYLKKGFQVVAVEANPELCTQAIERFGDAHAEGRFKVLTAAVAEKDGPITFYRNAAISDWGTTSEEWMLRNAERGARSEALVVSGRRFESILKETGIPYYLKIDIEGFDQLCVKALRSASQRPRYLSFESTMTSWQELLAEFALLRELGYRRFKVVNQLKVPKQICPRPPLEGRFVEHTFVHGASGCFGHEAPGRWLSESAAIALYRAIFVHYRLFAPEGLLGHLRWHRRGRLIAGAHRAMKRFFPEPVWFDTHATF